MLVIILTNNRVEAYRMSVTDIAALLRQAGTSEYALDSSKLRSGATRRVEEEGLVQIEKYHQAVAYLISPSLVEEFVEAAETRDRLARDLPVVARLLSTALKLGIAPEQAVQALLGLGESRAPHLDVAALAGMLEAAVDDLDAAAVARERLASSSEGDITLAELADDLGFDLDEIRAEVDAGSSRAQLATS